MNIAVIGAGNVGGNLAACFAKAGHKVVLAASPEIEKRLQDRAKEIGHGVEVALAAEAVKKSEVVVLSVMWAGVDTALAQAGDLSDKVVLDTTNQYGPEGLVELETSIALYNQGRMPKARLVRAFNMLTAEYQKEVANGKHQPVAMFFAAEDERARQVADQLIPATGFQPVYLGGWDQAQHIEAPAGMLVGKSYRPTDARAIAQALLEGNSKLATEIATSKQL